MEFISQQVVDQYDNRQDFHPLIRLSIFYLLNKELHNLCFLKLEGTIGILSAVLHLQHKNQLSLLF